jgi:predicted SprT family Zn-dependent metalloprotease
MLTKQEVTEFALDELKKQGISCPVVWTNVTGFLGRAHWELFGDKVTCTKIELSERWLNSLHDKYEMLDTVLHEIAHAVAYKRHGQAATGYAAHGPHWKAIAVELGAIPKHCANADFNPETLNKYRASCAKGCGKYYFNRMGRHWQSGNYCCRKCGGGLKITQLR